jgi:hypothetical protein
MRVVVVGIFVVVFAFGTTASGQGIRPLTEELQKEASRSAMTACWISCAARRRSGQGR